MLNAATATPRELEAHGLAVNRDGARRSAFALAAQTQFPLAVLARVWPELADIPADPVHDSKRTRNTRFISIARPRMSPAIGATIGPQLAPQPRLRAPLRSIQRDQAEVHRRPSRQPWSGPAHRRRHPSRVRAHRRACTPGRAIRDSRSASGGDVSRPPNDPSAVKLANDRRTALRLVPVSRETEERLATFVALLDRWRHTIKPIANPTFASVWTRHIADFSRPARRARARRETLGRHGLRRRAAS